jgi:hypothetical protein
VDFSYSQNTVGVYIYSGRKKNRILGAGLVGVFDDRSFALALVAALAMTFLVWFIMRNSFARLTQMNGLHSTFCMINIM